MSPEAGPETKASEVMPSRRARRAIGKRAANRRGREVVLKAVTLREKGHSVPAIARQTGTPVGLVERILDTFTKSLAGSADGADRGEG